MRVMILGNGAREHALAHKIAASPKLTALYTAPGNTGTALLGENITCNILDPAAVVELSLRLNLDLVVVGGEAPLEAGVADAIRQDNPPCAVFGPSRRGARLEWSKAYAKHFMDKYGLPTADYRCFTEAGPAQAYLSECSLPVVVKADGLAAGKGVAIAHTREQAKEAAALLAHHGTIIVEEFLLGREASVLVLTDGQNSHMMPPLEDHKQLCDGDEGPNTGGMGAYSPVAYWNDDLQAATAAIVASTLTGLRAEGVDYRGVIYLGLMLTNNGIKLLEFNSRFGDPECQVLLTKLDGDILPYLYDAARGELSDAPMQWSRDYVSVVVACGGEYPGAPSVDAPITGLAAAEATGCLVFHAGTALREGELVTNGGRILSVVGRGASLGGALKQAYAGLTHIHFNGMHYRRDIGRRGER